MNKILIIILILVFLSFFNKESETQKKSINVTKKHLLKVLKPGSYTGESNISSSELHPKGLHGYCKLDIKEVKNGVEYTNEITYYDNTNNMEAFTLIRIGGFYYKKNHEKNLFRIHKSYIGNELVSSTYGYATKVDETSILFDLSGSWHISKKDYEKIYFKLERKDNKLVVSFHNIDKETGNNILFNEIYQ